MEFQRMVSEGASSGMRTQSGQGVLWTATGTLMSANVRYVLMEDLAIGRVEAVYLREFAPLAGEQHFALKTEDGREILLDRVNGETNSMVVREHRC